MGRDLTNLYISASFEGLVQISGSELTDGTGSLINFVDISSSYATSASQAEFADIAGIAAQATIATTASYVAGANVDGQVASALSASHAITASYSLNAEGFDTGSLMSTGSVTDNVLTFTKGDGSTFDLTVDTGSTDITDLLNTASISNATITFTKEDTSTFDITVNNVVNADSASVADTATSSSHALSADTAISASHAINADIAISASHALNTDNALVAISASHALLADNALIAGTASYSSYSNNTIVYGKNLSGGTIAKGTPLYFTGSGTAGNLVGVYPADAGDSTRMPAGGIAGEQILDEAEGIVLLDGFINGVDTSLFNSGDQVWVAVGGGYTNIRPTGSNNLIQPLGYVEKSAVNGSGVIHGPGIERAMPNIQQDYLWVGDADGVAQPVDQSTLSVASATTASYVAGANVDGQVASALTASHAITASLALDVDNNANLNVSSISASSAIFVSASIGFLQTITGSATIIGDQYIVVNTTDVNRFAGIQVYESGSVVPTTASLKFDSQTNDWFYEYTGSDPTNFGVVMFGPEYGTEGSPSYPTTNTLVKGNGGHHLIDSSITDDGSTVSMTAELDVTGGVTASAGFLGNLTGNADTATSASHATNADNADTATSASYATNAGSADTSISASYATSAGSADTATSSSYAASASYADSAGSVEVATSASYVSGSSAIVQNLTVESDATFNVTDASEYVYINGDERYGLFVYGSAKFGDQFNNVGNQYHAFIQGERNTIVTANNSAIIGARESEIKNVGAEHDVIAGGRYNLIDNVSRGFIGGGWTNTINADDAAIIASRNSTVASGHSGSVILGGGSITTERENVVYVPSLKVVNGSVEIDSGSFSGSAIDNITDIYPATPAVKHITTLTQAEYNAISASADPNTLYTITDADSFSVSASYSETAVSASYAPLDTSLDNNWTGENVFSGSVYGEVSALSIASNTASMNVDTGGNFFTLTLVNGSNTHLVTSAGINPGQTISLKVQQPAGGPGTLTLDSNLKFNSGSTYTATPAANAEDILTFISFDATNLYVSAVQNLV